MDQPDNLAILIAQFVRSVLSPENSAEQECRMRATLKKLQIDPADMVQPQSDATLVRALQLGFFFAEVYNEIVARYERQIRGWLGRWGVEYHRALELTQMLLLLCFRTRLHRYRPVEGRSLAGYLRRAAYNIWIERDVRGIRPTFKPLSETLLAATADPQEEAATHEMVERVRQAMTELPDELRAVLELALEDHSHAVIAECLGITVIASQQRLFQARRELAKRLGLTLPPTRRGRPRKDPPSPYA